MYDGILRHRKPPVPRDDVQERFDNAEAAPTFPDLVPKGEYVAHWKAIKVSQNRNGKPRAVLTFEIVEGEFAGKRAWCDLYLTEAATPRSKRELAKLGISTYEDMTAPVPQWLRCLLRIVVETDDDEAQRNKITDFTVIAFEDAQPDPFAPQEEGGAA